MEPPRIPWRRLGQLLVERGLLTTEDLKAVLAEQKRTGRRLGEIAAERGLISWPALTTVLAAQYGLELATEDGFGTGLRTELERRHGERRAGVDRRRHGDRRRGDRRQGDRRQAAPDAQLEVPAPPSEPGELPAHTNGAQSEPPSHNGNAELELLRATHHGWLVELTEKFEEQHGYLTTAAAKIDEHEQSLAELRLANDALNKEVERLRTEVTSPKAPAARRRRGTSPETR